MKKISNYLLVALFIFSACDGFLDEKPSSNLLIPKTIQDLEELLDGTTWGINRTPALLELSTDNLSIGDQGFNGLSVVERNAYIWRADIFELAGPDWDFPYRQIFAANVVLDQGKSIKVSNPSEQKALDEVMGRALWMRAQAYFQLLSTFAAPFDPKGPNTSPGVPMRLSPAVGVFVDRGTVGEDYEQVVKDLEMAVGMLPNLADYKTRPSKLSTYALLARIYLAMERYDLAEINAGKALEIYDQLMNYNSLDPKLRYPFPLFNPEVIHHLEMMNYSYMNSGLTFVDHALYQKFEKDDLRKELFFTPAAQGVNFDGNYSGSRVRFSGLATNELYLILAESAVRNGRVAEGMRTLNVLLETRWKKGTFIPLSATTQQEALEVILLERRKELLFRGLRWTDLRRLNRDPKYAKVLTRKIGGETFELQPNSIRYVLPIPPEEIQISGIVQNPR